MKTVDTEVRIVLLRLAMPIFLLAGCAHEQFLETPMDVGAVSRVDAVTVPEEFDAESVRADMDLDQSLLVVDAASQLDAETSEIVDVEVTSDAADMFDIDQMVTEVEDVSVADMSPPSTTDAMLPVDANIPEPSPLGYTLCGTGMRDRQGEGTWADPIRIGRFPFVDKASTNGAGSMLADRYDCAETTGERGREIVYHFSLEHPGEFLAEVVDASGVDIDLHLLQAHEIRDGLVTGCLGRAHRRLAISNLEPGEYIFVADSWSSDGGAVFEGGFELAIDVFSTRRWEEIPLSSGLTWVRFQGPIDGAWQNVNALRVAPSAWSRMRLEAHEGCETVVDVTRDNEFLAGVNGGFFGGGCAPKGFLRVDDTTLSYSAPTESDPPLLNEARVGWRDQNIWFFWREVGAEWSLPKHALGLHPMLVQDGIPRAEVQEGEQVYSAVDWGENPRTALAHTDDGDVLLLTLDGRTPAGAGISTPALANWLHSQFGVRSAINLDGGGSTTFVVNDCWVGPAYGDRGARAFNAPSDNGLPDENGARPVGNGIYLESP